MIIYKVSYGELIRILISECESINVLFELDLIEKNIDRDII